MTSQVDPSVPAFGAPTTASVRNNFLIIKNELEALQSVIVGSPGNWGPPINIGGSGPVSLPSGANFFILVNNLTGTPISIALPAGLAVGQQLVIKDIGGNAGTYTITITPPAGSSFDGNPNYQLVSNYASLSVVWLSNNMWGTF